MYRNKTNLTTWIPRLNEVDEVETIPKIRMKSK